MEEVMLDNRFSTFLEVCKQMSYTNAAKELFITQPAVSQHIKYIEDKYHIKLFKYEGRNLNLTKEGLTLLRYIEEINATELQFIEIIRSIKKDIKHVAFGATLTIGEFSLEPFIDNFYEEFNDYEVSIIIDNTRTLLRMLKSGEIQFALIEGFVSKSDYCVKRIKLEDFVMVASPDNPLAGKKSVDIEEILNNPIIVREKGSGSRDILEKGLAERNLTFYNFKRVLEIGNINLIKSMTMKNLGITFLYKDAVEKEIKNNELVEVNIDQFKLVREFNFVTLQNTIMVDSTKEFYEYLKDCLN